MGHRSTEKIIGAFIESLQIRELPCLLLLTCGLLVADCTGQTPAVPSAVNANASDSELSAKVGVTHAPLAILKLAQEQGDARRGLQVFASTRFACVACHQLGEQGGRVGPPLTNMGRERPPQEIVESILFPKAIIRPEYVAHLVITEDGHQHRGYLVSETPEQLMLKEPSTGALIEIPQETIEGRKELGTLMPEGLAQAMSAAQLADLVRFLLDVPHPERLDQQVLTRTLRRALSHAHGPAEFVYDKAPWQPGLWPQSGHPVNRDRIYDFYTKQAHQFRNAADSVALIPHFPGLDSGTLGHWGNQNEESWADDRWNQSDLGSLQSGVVHGGGKRITRGICVQIDPTHAVCFDSDSLTYPLFWKEGFLKFSAVRHGFMHGLQVAGNLLPAPQLELPPGEKTYLGLYRDGTQVVFHYRIGEIDYLDAPRLVDGEFLPLRAPVSGHPLRHLLQGGAPRWPQQLETEIQLGAVPQPAASSGGSAAAYVVDTIELPFENPWQSLLFIGDHAFLPDGSAVLCTMQGDVWTVSNFSYPERRAVWKRFASGLHQPLGLHADADGIFVLGRDQITRLIDLNGNGEADAYECFSKAYQTSPAGHDYICGLQRDADGYFYTASGNQGLLKISPDGKRVEVLATGFRNPDGLGLTSDGWLTVPCSEGSWTPASMICAVPSKAGPLPQLHPEIGGHQPPYFGLGGPRAGRAPDLPLVYLPRGLDNSSGGQVEVTSSQWGPLQGAMLHLSFGAGTHFLLLRDEVDGQQQGAVIPLPGDFRSGVHRGRFHPVDGQLYVSGMGGWGSYTPDDGCFQRVRYTGAPVTLPTRFRAHQNGILLEFPIQLARMPDQPSAFAQAWNYRYSGGYGSLEFSPTHFGTPGHDLLLVTQTHWEEDGKSLFVEIPDLQPVNQLHLNIPLAAGESLDLFLTIHALAEPYTADGKLAATARTVDPHPILTDLAFLDKVKPNPWNKPLDNARPLQIEAGTNLSFVQRTLRARAGETLQLTFRNPDVVPHNWVLVQPGTLASVGDLANKLVADPEAFVRHYIPQSDAVLVYTDVTGPNSDFTIFFTAPSVPGTYPYLCTFPGHWLVMNGELIVE